MADGDELKNLEAMRHGFLGEKFGFELFLRSRTSLDLRKFQIETEIESVGPQPSESSSNLKI
jgi:hypothetical protein